MVEQAPYTLIRMLDKVEIRKYSQLLMARVDDLGDRGFNVLFRYINGHNIKQTKIAMTAPVISEQIAMTAPVVSGSNYIAFILPQQYSIETAPQPRDNLIQLVTTPPRLVAALRFSGRWSESSFTTRSQELLKTLHEAEIKTKGNVFSMRYDGPFTLWFLRRNEVAVEIEVE
ncbi:MAG: heme-binding protein [Candidatus Bathyarchaeota archaeon]|jgi:hypothetical protein|nr:heme-binding protein [Candidatus Bathyarchaeota archaeon]